MQPEVLAHLPTDPAALSVLMERVILDVRCHWFGSRTEARTYALRVKEPGGEMLMLVDAPPCDAEGLLRGAKETGAYVVTTSFTTPEDLGMRLLAEGYRLLQRQRAYLFSPKGAARPAREPRRSGLLSLLSVRSRGPVTVDAIGADRLADWTSICWRVFGAQGTRDSSLEEKRRAFDSMGNRGTWYLALDAGEPVGTACVYQGVAGAQVMAVGTLPGHRGRGVATALMERAIADWQSGGWGMLFLDTTPGSLAERLYVNLGFRHVYNRDLYGPPPIHRRPPGVSLD